MRSLFLLLCLPAVVAAAEPVKDPAKRPTNRLAKEASPYLQQHKHNPVDWFPWGSEAFAKAKKEGKLIFLSIGYSSCFWCHVMERESFENEAIAKLLNDNFVCIKVDREERPDIDHIYLTALHVLGQRGGWPLSMFLTADGKPIFGGTYWPPEDKERDGEKIIGFKSLLTLVKKVYADKPKEVHEQAEGLAKDTAGLLTRELLGIALLDLDQSLVKETVDALKEQYDSKYGGFGNRERNFKGTKFPQPPLLELLLRESERQKSAELRDMVTKTLDQMAIGGIYDHMGGGFHRYSTERTWTVPHFEKMLYDNAQLVELYAEAYRLTEKPLYKRVIQQTLGFVAQKMTAAEGGFYSALDAETAGEEGRYYVWTGKEIDAVLTGKEGAELFKKVYSADGAPNFEEKYHILRLPKPPAEVAAELKLTEEQLEEKLSPLRQKMLQARSRRAWPFLDTKVLTAWNGQMIAGYARAGQVLKEPRYIEAAGTAADFVLNNLRTRDGRLLRTYGAIPGEAAEARLNGYLDDYAFLVHGLLNLHDATDQKKWLDEAKALTDTMMQFHHDKDQGGFFYTSNDHEKLFARAKDQHDGAQPSGNSVAAHNLIRLAQKTGDDRYRRYAERTLKAFGGALKANPGGLAGMADALGLFLATAPKE
jgi:uncharacterized protein YyaL (SSP411 family)